MNRSTPTLALATIAAVAVFAMAGCSPEAASVAASDDLAGALSQAQVACDVTEPRAAGSLAREQLSCPSSAGDLELFVFAGEEQRDNWLLVGGQLGPVAVGPNWTVRGDSELTEQAAAALNARLQLPD